MGLRLFNSVLLLFFLVTLSSCDLIEGVFKLGIWLALLAIVIVIAIIVLIFNSVSYKSDQGEKAPRRATDSR